VSLNVFETILGIPAHPLLVHAAVVFVPLLVAAALAYPLIPRLRQRIAWAVVALAVVAPLSALFAKLSGDSFRNRLIHRDVASPEILAKISEHQSYGTMCLYLAAALGLVTLVFVLLRSRPAVLSLVLTVISVGLSLVTGYYAFRTGDTGAHIVWQGL
jgi:uncharacterized membrane protein